MIYAFIVSSLFFMISVAQTTSPLELPSIQLYNVSGNASNATNNNTQVQQKGEEER